MIKKKTERDRKEERSARADRSSTREEQEKRGKNGEREIEVGNNKQEKKERRK